MPFIKLMSYCHEKQGVTSSKFEFQINACPTKGQQAKKSFQ